MRLPCAFVSHGAPTMAKDRYPKETVQFFERLGKSLRNNPSFKRVLCISAHWETTEGHAVSGSAKPEQIYDFYGFPKEYYSQDYDLKGDPELADRVVALLASGDDDIACVVDKKRGIDHGAWIVMRLMFPQADVPIVQLSLNKKLSYADHIKLGISLQPLRNEGCFIVGSGGAVHNLGLVDFHADKAIASWAKEFEDLLVQVVTAQGNVSENLVRFAQENKDKISKAHPRTEHFMPLFVTAGCLETGEMLISAHRFIIYKNLSLAAFTSQ